MLSFEYFFLGLRKTAGVSISKFAERFGASIEDYYGPLSSILVNNGFMETSERLALPKREGAYAS